MKKFIFMAVFMSFLSFFNLSSGLAETKVGETAPDVTLKTHEGKTFRMADQKGKWTVLYFYPKADTPGCTKQACAFRDNINVLKGLNAEIYGVSGDSVADIAAFHKKHRLTFTLLSDADAKAMSAYGTKMPVVKISKRWTFIIDPELKVRHVDEGADPVKDADNTAKLIAELQKK